jgi:CubicO group peptidase (beta-lactamase class C family)
MKQIGSTLAVVVVLAAAPATARADAIDDYIGERTRELRLPGVAIAVVRDGEVGTIRSYGIANLELDVPVTNDTVFEIGSVTKQFTAVALMMLVEEGKVRLDDSITKHLPQLPVGWRAITVRHLLTHSSGIQEYLSVPGLPDQAHAARSHDEMSRLLGTRLKLEFKPGETWAYNNSGYLLLGNIIERASGRTYWEFLRERIFAPLGMNATRSSDPRALIPRRAAGYGWHDASFVNRDALHENAYSAGAIVSTIADMARWAAAVQESKLLSQQSWDEMWTPLAVSRSSAPPFSYGFGWVIDREHGSRAILHSGGTPGFSAAIRQYLDKRLAVIVLTNHGDRILDHLPMEIAGIVAPQLAREQATADPDPARSERLKAALRGLLSGKPDAKLFTPAMQLFLKTSSGRGLSEWIASHGELKSLTYSQTETADENSTLRYRAVLGDAHLWFSFTVTRDEKIAQVSWW